MTGLKELAPVVEGLPHLLQDCGAAKADVATLESWATVFLHPADLPALIKSNITHNLIKLTRDLNKAKQDWAAEEYFTFGTVLGDMLVIATQPAAVAF